MRDNIRKICYVFYSVLGRYYVLTDQYLIKERPRKALFYFALPMIIGNIFQQTYTMVDSMVVGRYVGEDAMAAIGACYSFTNIFIWVAGGGGIGASVIVSRLFGAGQYQRMKTAIRTALLSFLALSVVLGAVGLLIGSPVMRLLRTPSSVLPSSLTYLNIYFLGLPFLFMYNVLSSMFNAIGKSRYPLYFLVFSSLLNIALDLWFVLSFGLGIAGVAWATLIAQGISSVLSLTMLIRLLRTRYKTDVSSANASIMAKEPLYDLALAREMASVALPSIIQQSTVSIGMMVVQSVVNSFGAESLAGYSVGMRIENFCTVPWGAFNAAISAYTAQNIGAGQKSRVREGYRAVLSMIFICAVLIFLVLEPLAPHIVRFFLGENMSDTALQVGRAYIRCDGIFLGLLGMKMCTDGTLRGAQDTKVFTIANLVNLGIRIFISFTFAPVFGIQMVWLASPIGWFVNWLISYMHFRHTEFYR